MVYTFNRVEEFLKHFNNIELIKKDRTKKEYYNVAVSFDIETSSIYLNSCNESTLENEDTVKCANMYIWQFAIDDKVIYGRYWKEFLYLLDRLNSKLSLNDNRRLVVYVHNLSFEFQFIYKIFEWKEVFAITERKPIFAVTTTGIEFRCSYILSGYGLATLANNLTKTQKLVGDLDYSLVRHNETPLTDKELEYCFNDVLIVNEYINEMILEYGDVSNIPYTQTGKVRRYVRQNCFIDKDYKNFIHNLKLTVNEYEMLQECYAGGFTHSNSTKTGYKIADVSSYDFTSSYPYVMLSEKYPMSTGRLVFIDSEETFKDYLKKYCCLFRLSIKNVKAKTYNENILQVSKCANLENPVINNGRIMECESCDITVNEIDYFNLNKFYSYTDAVISNFYVYEKDYLPKPIIKSILKLYSDKTTLKGVEGKEKEYLNSKEQLNSIYGMCITNTMKENVIFDTKTNEWKIDENFNIADSVKNYNDDKSRFLFYPWGVWVTSYARRNLFTGILECGRDYIYADTDSLKIENAENHKQYFDNYNIEVENKLQKMCSHYDIDFTLCKPKTIKGVEKLIGVWDYEGKYNNFKTLGAKRYMTEKNGNYEITIAGLPKKAVKYMIDISKENNIDVFDFFNSDMYIPVENSGKNTHTYIDNEYLCFITDYKGKTKKVLCKSGVHLSPCDFTLNLGLEYAQFLIEMKNIINMK